MENLCVRPMVSGDFPAFDRFDAALHALHQQARPDLFAPCRHLFTREEFESMLGDPRQILLIAEAGGAPAGICAARLAQPPDCPFLHPAKALHIGDLFVEEGYRRRGVGRALLEAAQRLGREKGAQRLTLLVWPFNQGALAFYERLGFAARSITLEAEL